MKERAARRRVGVVGDCWGLGWGWVLWGKERRRNEARGNLQKSRGVSDRDNK